MYFNLFYICACIFCRIFLALVYYYIIVPTHAQISPAIKPIVRYKKSSEKNYEYNKITILYYNWLIFRILCMVYYCNSIRCNIKLKTSFQCSITNITIAVKNEITIVFQSLDDNLFSANSRFKDSICKSALSSFM